VIGRLTGTLVERAVDGSCVLDVQGVGYELSVPAPLLFGLPEPPEPVTLHVHTHVREDSIALFGFPAARERAAFRALLSVANVGPRLALAVRSALDPDALADALAREDAGAFRGIPGVGKKTAERILIDLKDRLPKLLSGAAPSSSPRARATAPAHDGPLATVASALVQMGYKPAEAERAIAAVAPEADGKPIETLLRDALRALG
jgi:Holliday junction DNA helicase RuvA